MTDAPLPDLTVAATSAETSIFGPLQVTRVLLLGMVLAACGIFVLGSRFAFWPRERGFQGSLAQKPVSLIAFGVVIGLLVACTALGTLVLQRRWFLAGLMTATAGLTTWAVRGGTTTFVLLRANNSGVNGGIFLQLLVELIVLYGVIAAIWNFLWVRRQVSAITTETSSEQGRSAGAALVAQSALIAVFILIFVATTQKKQVLAGVFLSALFATALAEHFFADRKAGRWYWAGPLVAGAFGYLANYFSPAGIEIGDLTGMFAPLGRVLPLDYASVGCAGVLLGYWWMTPGDEEEPAEPTASDMTAESNSG